ncbi:MAG: phosphate signaling complex protein PhoU [Chromatiales bacterium]
MNSEQSTHTVKQYDEELAALRQLVLEMGALVKEQIAQAVAALERGDVETADLVINRDHEVNGYDVKIDEETVALIARRQPVARDLRLLMSLVKTVADFERIGDKAKKIGQMTLLFSQHAANPFNAGLLRDVSTMGKLALEMLEGALDALAHLDVAGAVTIARRDRELDAEYQTALRCLVTYMMEDPRMIGQAIDILFVIKALERVGDHAKNIAEYVIYLVKGKDVRHVSLEHLAQETGTNNTSSTKHSP